MRRFTPIPLIVFSFLCLLPAESPAVAQDGSSDTAKPREEGGDVNFCPVCENSSRFRPFGFGEHKRDNARCPKCKSLERHRLLYLYLEHNWPDLFMYKNSLLHFAANNGVEQVLRTKPGLRYVTADLYEPADLKLDITAIDLPDESFDGVICYHVLEHVEEDGNAMAELFRIIKPDGWAIIQVPVFRDRPETLDDPAIVTPEDRTKYYGSPIHLRLYGWRDFKNQLEEVGFNVRIEKVEEIVDPALFEKYGLDKNELVYFCGKPLDSDQR